MAREKTKYPGVFKQVAIDKATGKEITKYFIQYYDANKKRRMEKAGQSNKGMTASKANTLRGKKIEGKKDPKTVHRAEQKRIEHEIENKKTFSRLFRLFQESKGDRFGKQDQRLTRGYSSSQTDESIFNKHLKEFIGDLKPSELLKLHVQNIKRHCKKRNQSDQSTRHILEMINRLSNFGFKEHEEDRISFVITMPEVHNEKTEVLTDDQLGRLLYVLRENQEDSFYYCQAKRIMKMILQTGVRKIYLLRLHWSWIDFENNLINFPAKYEDSEIDPEKNKKVSILKRGTKSGKNETVLLNPEAKRILQKIQKERKSKIFVFTNNSGEQLTEAKRQFQKIKELSNLPDDFRYCHGLRHVYATRMAKIDGMTIEKLSELLTHSDIRMTQRYVHYLDSDLREHSDKAVELFKTREV